MIYHGTLPPRTLINTASHATAVFLTSTCFFALMQLPFRTHDMSGGSNPRAYRHRRSSSSVSLRHASQFPGVPPTRDIARQPVIHLDFIIVGGGLFHARDTTLLITNKALHQESLDFLQLMPSLHLAIAFKCLSKRAP